MLIKKEEANINKANSKAKTAIRMNTAYHKFLTVYTDKGLVYKFFKGKNKSLHLKFFQMLKDNKSTRGCI